MIGRCIIVAGGPYSDCCEVSVAPREDDYIIACDAGYLTAQKMGLKPHLVVGDFDSFHGKIDPSIEVFTVPAKKNDTDTLLGMRKGLERGCRDFIVIGGFGGRLDHSVANLQSLCFLCENGARGVIVANENRAWAIKDGTIEIPQLAGYHISVFAADGVCEGVTLSQMAYPLENYTLTPSFPLGISNEFAADTAKISVKRGTLLIIASKENALH